LVSSDTNIQADISQLQSPKDNRQAIITEVYDGEGKLELINPSRGLPQITLSFWIKALPFLGLLVTTTLSTLLLATSIQNWITSGSLYRTVVNDRASTQLVVQITATVLGLLHTSAICKLINYSTRIRLTKTTTFLDTLAFLRFLAVPNIHWDSS